MKNAKKKSGPEKQKGEAAKLSFRSDSVKRLLDDLVAANPGKITSTAVLIAAAEEKIRRLKAGEAQALNLVIPPSWGLTPEERAEVDAAVSRAIDKRRK